MTSAPDGSPIDLYLRLPSFGEADRIHELIPAGADVLELGCGVGRVTHELIRLGHAVTAVDESDAMLAHIRGAEPVRARIEELDLRRRFGCVLLMSQLVNVPDDDQRRAFLRACARHVAADGVVIVERHEPGWQPVAGRGASAAASRSCWRTCERRSARSLRPFATRPTPGRGGIRSSRACSTTRSSTASWRSSASA